MSAIPKNPDVIVIGAGVAGLAAAKALLEARMEPLVLEASGHIGGRCVTDNTSFSVPFDLGASWLHSASINPLARLAEKTGARLHKAPWKHTRVHALGHNLSEKEVADYQLYQRELWRAVRAAGQNVQDETTASAMPDGPFVSTAWHSIPQMLGADADLTSAQDASNYADSEGDWLVEGGLGNFLGNLHRDVPVELNCPVTKIDYSGPRVRVVTPRGTVEARKLVLTVSTGVLAAGNIRFTPQLPNSKLDAIHMLPNGLLNKIGIEFLPTWTQAVQGQMADYHSGDNEFCSLLFGFFGTSLATGFVAGRFADELEQAGPNAAIDYCMEALRSFFGNDINKSILRTGQTSWRSNSHALGSYSYARPGGTWARCALAEPIGNKIIFAGEATMSNSYSTVHGAYLSGKEAASQVVGERCAHEPMG
ncbi:flavin monoamine oxidase family protein [Primorskyibacter sp. S87]|uniref:flavin monoamine oxidase family protein n=1 Tax=Primorskyibacter sp. S87 TaxID=3415126 RepID=UPI003C7ABDCC